MTNAFFNDSGLSGNTLYRYRVRGTNSAGDGSYSGIGQQQTLPPPVPATPGTPTFSNVTASAMRVNWTAASGATSYKVEQCSSAGCSNFAQIASNVTNLFLDVSTLTANTSYSYRVRGTNAQGDGPYSASAAQITSANPPTCTLSATPSITMPGQASTLSWSSTNATSGTVNNGVGAVGTSGSTSVSPSMTTTYTATFTGPGGSVQCQTTLTITACTSTSNSSNMHGFAWSENIGWISFNSSDNGTCTPISYGVNIDAAGNMVGYAWSENIGWIQFGGLTGFPSGSGTIASNAKMVGTALQGWARALAYQDAQAGGWDGWISLSGTGTGFSYGPTLTSGTFSGYAWGSDVIGWIDFNAEHGEVTTDFAPCGPAYQCVDPTHYDNLCTPSINENQACDAGLICAFGAVPCVPPGNATGDLWLSPQLVPTGDSTRVSWNVIDTDSCHVFGDNGDEWFGSGEEGPFTSSPIRETTKYTLECANVFGAATSTVDTAWGVVVPTWVER